MTAPFRAALGADFARLPDALQALHGGGAQACQGLVEVAAAPGLVARLIARIAGFPPAGQGLDFAFAITPGDGQEVWHRQFGQHITRSVLRAAAAGQLRERFGPFHLTLDPQVGTDGFSMTITGMRILGLPLPRILLPQTDVMERAGPDGAIHFDIAARLPVLGPLIRYRGRMRLVSADNHEDHPQT